MILVTGANGFLGSFICRKLIEENQPFVALKRKESDTSLLHDIEDKITFIESDILDFETLDKTIESVDTIIHSAAIVSFHSPDKEKMFSVNVEGTKNLINLSIKHKIKQFIHVSSVAALGRNKASETVDETNKWEESKWNTNYGESKYLAELEVWRGHAEGLNTAIINPSVILGPGDWDRSSSALFKYVWEENKFYPKGLFNYVDVRDVTDVICKLLKQPDKFGERYILNAEAVSFKTILDKVAEHFGKKSPSIKTNSFLINLAVFFESLKYILTGRKPIITRETARVSNSRIYFDNTKVVNELNHTFAPLEDTLEWACKFYLKN